MKSQMALVAACCAALTACSDLPTLKSTNSAGEVVWQTLHAVDVTQTLRGPADDPCYFEGDPMTRRLIGHKPSQGAVIGWGVGLAALHYGVHRLLADYTPAWLDAAFEVATTVQVASIVHHNFSVGVRLGAHNDDPPQCIPHGDVYLPVRK